LQLHKKSGKLSHFVDENFEEYYPDEFEKINSDVFKQEAEEGSGSAKINSLLATSAVVAEPSERESVSPFNMILMFSKCGVLKKIVEDARNGVCLTHEQRLFLASQLKPFGEEGRVELHKILSLTANYDEVKTNYHWNSLHEKPQTCAFICKNKICANIKVVGGASPIKFGYQQNLLPFIEESTSSYAYYDNAKEDLHLGVPREILKQILSAYGQALPEKLKVLKVGFDVHSDRRIDEVNRRFNLFTPTNYLVLPKTNEVIDVKTSCKYIMLLLENLIPSDNERERFLNWLAGIMQTRKKQLTAWVLKGEQGAGKNLFLECVLQPLLGKTQAIQVEDEQLRNPFNSYLKNVMLIAFNEVAHDNNSRNSIASKIKVIITESDMSINEKNVKQYRVENHVNCLFYSNNEIPLLVDDSDRRFNIITTGGNLRKQEWFTNAEEVIQSIEREVPHFAQYLMNYSYDKHKAKTVIHNAEKEALINVGMTRFEEFAKHLKGNDMEWFEESQNQDEFGNTIRIPKLKGKIEKGLALRLFKSIYQDSTINAITLSKHLKLYGIEPYREMKKGEREHWYMWNLPGLEKKLPEMATNLPGLEENLP